MQRGFELARDEINRSGRLGDAKITFITEDDQGTVEDAIEAYNKLIRQDGVSIILGPANLQSGSRNVSNRTTEPGCGDKLPLLRLRAKCDW